VSASSTQSGASFGSAAGGVDLAGVVALPPVDRGCLGAVEDAAGVAFVDFAGVFGPGGVLSELTASAGPGFAAAADFRGVAGFSSDRVSLIFAIGGEAGGGATVERASDLPGADDPDGRAPSSAGAAPEFGVPVGRVPELGVAVGCAPELGVLVGRAPELGVAGGRVAGDFPLAETAPAAAAWADPSDGARVWAGRGGAGAEDVDEAGALARPVATADGSSVGSAWR
jgi:hypothetical protein